MRAGAEDSARWQVLRRWSAVVLLLALGVTGCQDGFFFEPAAPSAGVAVTLSVNEASLAGTPLQDFEDANRARITLIHAGTVAHEETVGLLASSVGKRAVVRINVESETQFQVEAELLIDSEPVFVGTGSVTVTPGETASTEVGLTHTGGGGADATTGTYVLTSINGQSLPFTIPDEFGCDDSVIFFGVGLRADGRFVTYFVGEEVPTTADPATCGGVVDEAGGGIFTLSGENLTLNDPEEPLSGTLSGGVMTLTFSEQEQTFELRLARAPAPAGVEGTYTLTTVNGGSLPGVIPDPFGICDFRILSAGLTLRADGTAALSVTGDEVLRAGQTGVCNEVVDDTSESTYFGDGQALALMPFLELDIPTLATASVSGGSLTVTVAELDGSTITLRFEMGEGGGGETGTLSGSVVDAQAGNPLSGATVTISGAASASTATNATGGFIFSNLPAGTYTVTANASGFIEGFQSVTLAEGGSEVLTFALSQQLAAGQTRIVLTWGELPSDLDSHLTGPDGLGGQFHIFHPSESRGSSTTNPFAILDVDDVDGFGPETITIFQQFTGQYCYSVHNFSGTPDLSTSNARVEVFQGSTRIAEFSVPGGSGNVWTVFALTSGGVTPINSMSSGSPPGTCG